MRNEGAALAVATVLCCGLVADAAAVVTRPLPTVGEVVTAKGDETIRFVDAALTQRVEPTQPLAASMAAVAQARAGEPGTRVVLAAK